MTLLVDKRRHRGDAMAVPGDVPAAVNGNEDVLGLCVSMRSSGSRHGVDEVLRSRVAERVFRQVDMDCITKQVFAEETFEHRKYRGALVVGDGVEGVLDRKST